MSNKIRVGIVGAGSNTKSRHIPGLQAQPGVEIISVSNRSQASSESVASQFSIPKIHKNWIDLVRDPDIDAVVIGTWPYMHCRVTIEALNSGKHVLCEARMAMDAWEAHAMLDASSEHPELVAQIVPSPFTLGVDNTIRRLLAEGYLGDLLAIDVRMGGGFLDASAPFHWRMNMDYSGLNVMGLGIWYEALMRWVGPASTVMAMGKTFVKMRKDDQGILRAVRIPEHLDVIADMACGAQTRIQISSVTGLANPGEIFLYGSVGTLRFSDGKLFSGKKGDKTLQEIPVPPAEAGHWRVEEEFINAIRGTESIKLTTFEEAVKYMEFTHAVSISMAEGKSVSLPLNLG